MIGNDLVDLQQTKLDSNWKRSRFLQKILTESELEYLKQFDNKEYQEKIVWLLWSMKETAYKCAMNTENRRFYSPRSFQCEINISSDLDFNQGKIGGSVFYQNVEFKTKSIINDKYIYSYSSQENIFNEIFQLNILDINFPSKITHTKLIQVFAYQSNTDISNIKILKSDIGIPYLFNKLTHKKTACSITHHGQFSGVCFKNT